MHGSVAAIAVAFLAYSLKAVSQATQRVAIKKLRTNKVKAVTLWSVATVGTSGSVLVSLWAVDLGTVSVVGAMAGTGLVALTLYSHFVLHERVTRRETVGVFIIVLSIGLLGLFQREQSEVTPRLEPLLIELGAITATYCAAALISRRNVKVSGIFIGSLAGALGGSIPQFQKLSLVLSPNGNLIAGGSALPFTLGWIALSMISLAVMQIALARCQAIHVIPAFTCNAVLVPAIGGAVFFDEALHPLQWIGIALIVGAVLLITADRTKDGEYITRREDRSTDAPNR